MIVLEAIKAKMRPYPVPHTSIEVQCIEFGLDPKETYVQELKRETNLVCIELLKNMLNVSSISQSGASLGFDTDALRRRLIALMKEEGLDASDYAKDSVARIF